MLWVRELAASGLNLVAQLWEVEWALGDGASSLEEGALRAIAWPHFQAQNLLPGPPGCEEAMELATTSPSATGRSASPQASSKQKSFLLVLSYCSSTATGTAKITTTKLYPPMG